MNDDELIGRITGQLEAGVGRLDGATRSRLTQARHRALAARHRPAWAWPALGGAVLASLVTVMVWLGRPPAAPEPLAAVDFELLMEGDSVELYQEMEFLQWLEETQDNGVV